MLVIPVTALNEDNSLPSFGGTWRCFYYFNFRLHLLWPLGLTNLKAKRLKTDWCSGHCSEWSVIRCIGFWKLENFSHSHDGALSELLINLNLEAELFDRDIFQFGEAAFVLTKCGCRFEERTWLCKIIFQDSKRSKPRS